jgi:diphthamide synthase (EF-2-diphthine--ammonia ligase)
VRIPVRASNDSYEAAFAAALAPVRAAGVMRVAFGDLFLSDVRAYRERQLDALGMRPLFPLWLHDTHALAREFIARGFEAVLVCVDPAKIGRSFAGRAFDAQLLHDLPAGADPCGENGEFHTFVFNGPGFIRPVPIVVGPVVERAGFVFCDLMSGREPEPATRAGAPIRP